MHKYLLFITLVFASLCFAQDEVTVESLQKPSHFLSFHQRLVEAIVEIEKNENFPDVMVIEGETVNVKIWIDYIFNNAYADDDNEVCLFGGWPSLRQRGLCKPPWTFKNHPKMQSLPPTYDQDHFCGGKQLFRCNPLIFGPGDDGKGLCITFEKLGDVSALCHKRSITQHKKIMDKIKNDPDFAQKYVALANSVIGFCSNNTSYSACNYVIGNLVTQKNLSCGLNASFDQLVGGKAFSDLALSVNKTVDASFKDLKEVEKKEKAYVQSEDHDAADELIEKPKLLRQMTKFLDCKLSGVQCQLPYSNVESSDETGYFYYGDSSTGGDHWGTTKSINHLMNAAKNLKDQGMSLAIGDISRRGGGSFPPHAGHRSGKEVDIRFSRTDGKANTSPCYIGESCYSKPQTLKMLQVIIATNPQNMDTIFINDPSLREELQTWTRRTYPGTNIRISYCKGHDNHAHVRFKE